VSDLDHSAYDGDDWNDDDACTFEEADKFAAVANQIVALMHRYGAATFGELLDKQRQEREAGA
jgi:hypothetical protein